MLRDAEYFKARIGGLDGAGDAGDYIVNLVKEKSVPVATVAVSDPAPAATNGKTSSESGLGSKTEHGEKEKSDEKGGAKVENAKP
jgi:vacuolar protein sorting-associated protein 54